MAFLVPEAIGVLEVTGGVALEHLGEFAERSVKDWLKGKVKSAVHNRVQTYRTHTSGVSKQSKRMPGVGTKSKFRGSSSSSKRRKTTSSGSAGSKALTMVKKLVKNKELKHFDVSQGLAEMPLAYTSWHIVPCTELVQGHENVQRIGEKVNPKQLFIRARVKINSLFIDNNVTTWADKGVRWMVVQIPRQDTTAIPAITQYMTQDANTDGNGFYAFPTEHTHKFNVLARGETWLSSLPMAQSEKAVANGLSNTFPIKVDLSHLKRLGVSDLRYKTNANSSGVNPIYFCIWNVSTCSTNGPQIQFASRFRFTDS